MHNRTNPGQTPQNLYMPAPPSDAQSMGDSRLHPHAIRFNLTVPVLRIGIGLFSIDPLTQLLGQPLHHVLEPLLVSAPFQRPAQTGGMTEVYPLALPPGEGASIRLGSWGELGLANDRGLLKLIVPLASVGWIVPRLIPILAYGPNQALGVDGLTRVGELWIQLRPGMAAGLPLGTLGELGLEAA